MNSQSSEHLTHTRQRALVRRIEQRVAAAAFGNDALKLSEPSFTAKYLQPIVRTVLDDFRGVPLTLRGDGARQSSVPAVVLGGQFYPDLTVTFSRSTYLWAAEVKYLKGSNFTGELSKAAGQASLYLSRYSFATLVYVMQRPPKKAEIDSLQAALDTDRLGVVVISPQSRVGSEA